MSKREILLVEESGYKLNKKEQRMYEKAGFLYRGEQRLYAENTGVTDFLYYEKIPELDLFKEG